MNLEQSKHYENHQVRVEETSTHQATIAAFFRQIKTDEVGSLPYDHIEEFHISGNNSRLSEALRGSVVPDSVKVYYEQDTPKQVELYYQLTGGGEGIDITLKNKALEDYFDFSKRT